MAKGKIFRLFEVELAASFTVPGGDPEEDEVTWPSFTNKLTRAALARLQAINTANGFQTDIDTTSVVAEVKSLEWAMDHAPCLMIWVGDEDASEQHIGSAEKGLDLLVWGMTLNKDDPQTAREKLVEDVKDALYTPNRLEDPDEAGQSLGNGLAGVRVERDEGELVETGHAAFRMTCPYSFQEAIHRASA